MLYIYIYICTHKYVYIKLAGLTGFRDSPLDSRTLWCIKARPTHRSLNAKCHNLVSPIETHQRFTHTHK